MRVNAPRISKPRDLAGQLRTMRSEVLSPAAAQLVAPPPAAEVAANTHAPPLTCLALLTFADFILVDNVAHDAHGNTKFRPVKGVEDATGTATPDSVVNDAGKEEEGEELERRRGKRKGAATTKRIVTRAICN